MACAVCEHCLQPLSADDVVLQEGYSYHTGCYRCYVCSETNLIGAEVFKGVIFCSGCSQRIFQGCSTARHSKALSTNNRSRKRTASSKYREELSENSSHLVREKGVIELARRHMADSDSDSAFINNNCQVNEMVTVTTKHLQVGKEVKGDASEFWDPPSESLPASLTTAQHKAESGDLEVNNRFNRSGFPTQLTQNLLKQMNCPVVERKKKKKAKSTAKLKKKLYGSKHNKEAKCSDLRIAELGESTEIANMAFRKPSNELYFTNKFKGDGQQNESSDSMKSDTHTEVEVKSVDKMSKSESLAPARKINWLENSIKNLIKLPFQYFKSNFWDRSSVINVLVNPDDCEVKSPFVSRMKSLFREEIHEHQTRGVIKLYSTIQRRRSPYKLGWLPLPKIEYTRDRLYYLRKTRSDHFSSSSVCRRGRSSVFQVYPNHECSQSLPNALAHRPRAHERFVCVQRYRPRHAMRKRKHVRRCRHFRNSHSYRCMRAHVMKLAGPTKSELMSYRAKIFELITPNFIKTILSVIRPSIKMSPRSVSDFRMYV